MAEANLVSEIIPSLTDQLLLLYPNGPHSDSETVVTERLDQMLVSNGSKFPDLEAWRLALPTAIETWKAKTPAAEAEQPKPTSFSLFDKILDLKPPVTFDQIKEGSSSEERLMVCQKIDYLDDMFLEDWIELKLLLLKELRMVGNKGANFGFLKLHRKFYDLAVNLSEYNVVQYEVCQNVFDAITSHIQDGICDPNFLFSLIRTWCDMFLDITQRGLYSQECLVEMERKMLFLLRDLDPPISIGSDTAVILPAHLLALADGQVRWFRSWVQATSLGNVLSLLQHTNVIPDIINRCLLPLPKDFPSQSSTLMQYALYKKSVTIMASLLEKTRVACFPWHLFSLNSEETLKTADLGNEMARPRADKTPTSKSVEADNDSIHKLIDMFVQAIALEDSLEWTLICGNALEVILSGCKNTAHFDQHFQRVSSGIKMSNATAQHYWNGARSRLQ
eukprot:scaffold22592_cov129-Cylindrotheca_fusiformis.AAC.7